MTIITNYQVGKTIGKARLLMRKYIEIVNVLCVCVCACPMNGVENKVYLLSKGTPSPVWQVFLVAENVISK